MYHLVLAVHSLVRWLVIVVALVAVARGFSGWLRKRAWAPADERAGRVFMVLMDLQLLLGLLLFLVLSPKTTALLRRGGEAMADGAVRFWTTEHAVPMIIALILVHVGRVLSRRARDAVQKHRRAAILFGVATLIILLSIPWPSGTYGRPLLRLG